MSFIIGRPGNGSSADRGEATGAVDGDDGGPGGLGVGGATDGGFESILTGEAGSGERGYIGDVSGAMNKDGSGMAVEDPVVTFKEARSSMSGGDISGPGGSAMMFRS